MAFCSTKRIATPFEFISLTISNTSLIATGERPADGSSNNRIFGEVANALARASICLCPPDKFPALSFLLYFHMGKSSNIFDIDCLILVSIDQEPISKFSSIVKDGNTFST